MKNSYKIMAAALTAVTLAGCADLDTEYLGSVVTTQQKEEILAMNPDMALAGVTGCFSKFLTSGFDSNDIHYDYGYSSMILAMDCMGNDLASKDLGYNWYSMWEGYTSFTENGYYTYLMWEYMYDQIFTCNAVLASIDPDTESDEMKFYRGQALALRAFDYFVLAQCYARNYTIDPTALCVPIITDENSDEAATNGAPCATVTEVYDQILSDINSAVEMIESSGISPSSVLSSKPKRMFSTAAAYGLRARIYLTMHEYAKAASDAQTAINNFSGSPYSRSEMMRPAFISMDDSSWMWGIAVTENDRVTTSGIVNFPSHMGSFGYGYCTVGAWRWCSYNLYTQIPNSDVRKGWFLNTDFTSDHLTSEEIAYLADFISNDSPTADDGTSTLMPYTQVKYAVYGGILGNSTLPHDIPLMRVEEMYLILAEATGMSQGVSAGATILQNFVRSYRNPNYVCNATDSQESFQTECYLQRRIELWGEGFSLFDLKRLYKGVDRVGGLFPSSFTYQIEADDELFIYCIPLSEIQTNKQIDSSINEHRGGSTPTPVV